MVRFPSRKVVDEWHLAVLVAAFAGAALLVRVALHWQLPLPQCWLRKLTGIPCPTCGCTRSLLAWTELDLTGAFLFNPLFFLFCVVSLVASAWQLLRRSRSGVGKTELQHHALFPWLPWLTWRMAGALLVLNWLYLYWWLPK